MFDARVAEAVKAEIEAASFGRLWAAAASGTAKAIVPPPRSLETLRAKLRSAILTAKRHACLVVVDASHQGPSFAFRDAHGGVVIECSPAQAAALHAATPLTQVSVEGPWRATFRPLTRSPRERPPAAFPPPPWDVSGQQVRKT